MKKIFFVAFIGLSTLIACKKDKSAPVNTGGYVAPANDLKGKIGGQTWAGISGEVHQSSGSSDFFFTIWNVTPADPCNSFAQPVTDKVIFFTEGLNKGVTHLSNVTQTITLYDQETGNNQIISDGTLEILTIDTVANTVSGKITTTTSGDNYVNGNFKITYCK